MARKQSQGLLKHFSAPSLHNLNYFCKVEHHKSPATAITTTSPDLYTMKFFLATSFRAVLFQAIAMAVLVSSSVGDTNLRGAVPQTLTQTLENVECTLFLKTTRFMLPSSTGRQEKQILTEEKWTCEFDIAKLAGNFGDNDNIRTTVELKGVDNGFLETQGAKSGHNMLFASKAIVGDTNGRLVLEIPSTAFVQVLQRPDDLGNTARRRKLAASSGTLKALVVRVVSMNGIEPTASIDQLRSDVFEDKLCLKSQYEACSHGRLLIEPFHGTTETDRKISGGVVDVKISINPSNGNRDQLEANAKKRATEIYGDLASQFDLVMFSIPPGSGDWLAYAYINRFDSYFNDKWSSSVSTQVHEVGHNLGLAHSGEGSNAYGDQSGMMGFSYDADDAPNMCFNPAKNYQLGWYIEQQKFLNPLTDILAKTGDNSNSREYILNGVNDFQFGKNGSQDKLITLRLKQQNLREDYYVGFNRRAGMNSGTVEDANDVIILKKTGGPIEYAQSWKVSKLSAVGDSYTINKFDDSSFDVTVELISIVGKDAKLEISVTDSAPCNIVQDSNSLKFKNRVKRNCHWVAKRKEKRCARTWKGELLSEWCPRTCGSCPDAAVRNL